MKANELQIGDWVLFPHSTLPEKVQEINYVEGEGMCASFAASATLISVGIGNLEPIPLTSEILEKNGFKKDFEHDYIYWRPDCRKFCIVKELDTWYFAFRVLGETVDKSSGYICISECKYVHKLQHKLKDLEIEKEIIL